MVWVQPSPTLDAAINIPVPRFGLLLQLTPACQPAVCAPPLPTSALSLARGQDPDSGADWHRTGNFRQRPVSNDGPKAANGEAKTASRKESSRNRRISKVCKNSQKKSGTPATTEIIVFHICLSKCTSLARVTGQFW